MPTCCRRVGDGELGLSASPFQSPYDLRHLLVQSYLPAIRVVPAEELSQESPHCR